MSKKKKIKSALDLLKQKYIQGDKKKEKIYKKENKKFTKKVMGFFSEKDCKNFKPQVYYNKAGDLIEVMWESADYYGEWISHDLTLYKAQDDNRVVGCEINWIKNLIEKSE